MIPISTCVAVGTNTACERSRKLLSWWMAMYTPERAPPFVLYIGRVAEPPYPEIVSPKSRPGVVIVKDPRGILTHEPYCGSINCSDLPSRSLFEASEPLAVMLCITTGHSKPTLLNYPTVTNSHQQVNSNQQTGHQIYKHGGSTDAERACMPSGRPGRDVCAGHVSPQV